MTIRAAFVLKERFAVRQIGLARAGGVGGGGHRSQIRDDLMRLLIAQVGGRHGRSHDALHHDGDQFIVGGGAMERAMAEIDARYEIAIGPVAGGAIDSVKALTGLDVGGTVALLRR